MAGHHAHFRRGSLANPLTRPEFRLAIDWRQQLARSSAGVRFRQPWHCDSRSATIVKCESHHISRMPRPASPPVFAVSLSVKIISMTPSSAYSQVVQGGSGQRRLLLSASRSSFAGRVTKRRVQISIWELETDSSVQTAARANQQVREWNLSNARAALSLFEAVVSARLGLGAFGRRLCCRHPQVQFRFVVVRSPLSSPISR